MLTQSPWKVGMISPSLCKLGSCVSTSKFLVFIGLFCRCVDALVSSENYGIVVLYVQSYYIVVQGQTIRESKTNQVKQRQVTYHPSSLNTNTDER